MSTLSGYAAANLRAPSAAALGALHAHLQQLPWSTKELDEEVLVGEKSSKKCSNCEMHAFAMTVSVTASPALLLRLALRVQCGVPTGGPPLRAVDKSRELKCWCTTQGSPGPRLRTTPTRDPRAALLGVVPTFAHWLY